MEPLRLAGRVAYQFFEKQTGLFYDQPVRGGDGVTSQVDWIRFNGGSFFPQDLPPQNAVLVEFGYYFRGPRIGLFGQWGSRDFSSSSSADEGKLQAGVAWYWMGRNLSLKLGAGRLTRDSQPDRAEIVLQLQAFMF